VIADRIRAALLAALKAYSKPPHKVKRHRRVVVRSDYMKRTSSTANPPEAHPAEDNMAEQLRQQQQARHR